MKFKLTLAALIIAPIMFTECEKKEEAKAPISLYVERSYGIFENKAKNEQIFRKFEKIREIIKNS